MRHFYFLAACWIFLTATATAKDWVAAGSDTPQNADIELLATDANSSTLQVHIGGFYLEEIQTPQGIQYSVNIGEGTPILKKGCPDLPKLTTSLLIPDLADMQVEVLGSAYMDYENISIAPSKGNLLRTQNPAEVSLEYNEIVYHTDAFYPAANAALQTPYIMRDFRGQTLVIYPFQYNPQTKTLRVYTDLTLQINNMGGIGENPLYRNKTFAAEYEYNEIYSRHFINYKKDDRYTPVGEDGDMLIIAHDEYAAAMQPFIDWKTRRGIRTELVLMSQIGTTANQLKTFVQNYYDTRNLTYLLLVGDAEQVPTILTANGGESDVSYGYLAGNDHYPEIFVGRFSAENIQHVQTQVQKVLDYEIHATENDTFYKSVCSIASAEGPGDDNEMDYEHARNMANKLLTYTYNESIEMYDGTQGGNDAPGNPTAQMAVNVLEDGAGIILYAGHGWEEGCSTSGISSSEVESMSNVGKLPFFWSVACVNGDFSGKTCFAEAWLRATNGGKPSGAIATLMSTINQSWNPPMEGQDEMVNILIESYENNKVRSFGAISYNGCMQMNDVYGGGGDEMTDAWTCFGDPSFIVRTNTPSPIVASHDAVMFLGSTSFSVVCDAEGALAVLTLGNQIIGKAKVEGGVANFTFDPITDVNTFDITITGFNKIPYQGEVMSMVAEGAFVTTENKTIVDLSGNNNGAADYNEIINLHYTLTNLGVAAATGVSAVLSTTDEYITITDDNHTWGDIAPEAVSLQNDAFAFTVDYFVPDQHTVIFDLTVTDSEGHTWVSHPTLQLNAPQLQILNFTAEEKSGDGDGKIEAGEIMTVHINNNNKGHANMGNAVAAISSDDNFVIISQNTQDIAALNIETPNQSSFDVQILPTVAENDIFHFTYTLAQNDEYGLTKDFEMLVNIRAEDFESGDYTTYPWTVANNYPWTIDNTQKYEGTYSSKSGSIDDGQKSILEITMTASENGIISFYKKVSSEQDWDFLRFFIDGQEKGSWSGEVDWSQENYPVTAAEHTFRWEYEKDPYYGAGEDAAWLDFIILPKSNDIVQCVADAGTLTFSNATIIAQSTPIQTIGIGFNAGNVQVYTLLDEQNNIVDFNLSGQFEVAELGTYHVGVLNYPATANIENLTIGASIQSVTASCYDLYISEYLIEVVPDEVIGIAEEKENIHLQLAPNPAQDFIYLTFANNNMQQQSKEQFVAIYDAQGKQVKQQAILIVAGGMQQTFTIDIAHLPSGIYTLQLQNDAAIIKGSGTIFIKN